MAPKYIHILVPETWERYLLWREGMCRYDYGSYNGTSIVNYPGAYLVYTSHDHSCPHNRERRKEEMCEKKQRVKGCTLETEEGATS